MMRRHIAFLRAINVGGHTVKMDVLRALFEELGFSNVATLIASGNVIFEDAADGAVLERRIERHLNAALGYEVATFIRSPFELAAITAYQPFAAADINAAHTLSVGFLRDTLSSEAHDILLACRTDVDDLHSHGREIYWLRRVGSSAAQLSGARLEKAIGMPATLRNITTVRKLAAKYPAAI